MNAGIEVQFFRSMPEPGLLFRIRVEKPEGLVIDTTGYFPNSSAAHDYGMDLGNNPLAKVTVTAAKGMR